MGKKPFIRLPCPRAVDQHNLPTDLAGFYSEHEGVGLESSSDYIVKLCRLDQVSNVGWEDLFPSTDVPDGWEKFTALLVGRGMFFEEIVYVLDAPSCPPGSILAIGGSLVGVGGTGPYA